MNRHCKKCVNSYILPHGISITIWKLLHPRQENGRRTVPQTDSRAEKLLLTARQRPYWSSRAPAGSVSWTLTWGSLLFPCSNPGNRLPPPGIFRVLQPHNSPGNTVTRVPKKKIQPIWYFRGVLSLCGVHILAPVTGTGVKYWNESIWEDSRQWGGDFLVTQAESCVHREFPIMIRLQRNIYLSEYLLSFHLWQRFSISHFKIFCQY